jgi:glycosyltransferase involved in cell wall biosynthesis
LKVCIVSQQCGEDIRNGVGTYSHLLIRGLLEKGIDLRLVTTEKMGIDIDQVVVKPRYPDPTPNKWLSTAYSMSRALNGKELEGMGIDIVHFLDAREAIFTRHLGVPLIGTQHDFSSIIMSSNFTRNRLLYPNDWFKRIPYYRAARAIETKVLRRLDAIITVCEFSKRQISKGFGLDEEKVFVVYNGFTPGVEAEASMAFNERRNRILFAAGNFQRANLPLLLKALPLIKSEVPDVKLLVLGDDELGARLVSDIVDDSVREAVDLLGLVSHEEILHLMSSSKVFAMPSLYESFAFVYLEAMSNGVPVIAGKVGGGPELVRDGVDGYIVETEDVESTASKVLELLLDEVKWTLLSRNCLDRVGYFTTSKMVEETIGAYRKVLNYWNAQ